MSGPFVDEPTYSWDRIRELPIFMTEGTGADPSLEGSREMAAWMPDRDFLFEYLEVDGDHMAWCRWSGNGCSSSSSNTGSPDAENQGRRIRLTLNGQETVDHTEPDLTIPQTGLVGLQIHGDGQTIVRSRAITIEEL